MIVATGTGATGWALSISRATGVTIDLRPENPAAVIMAREPWPSLAHRRYHRLRRIGRGDILLLASRMNEGGVVFADGMEGDRLDFVWGRTLRVSVAERQLHFVPGRTPLPARRQAAVKAPAATATAKPAALAKLPPPPVRPVPATPSPQPGKSAPVHNPQFAINQVRRRQVLRVGRVMAVVILIALALLGRACEGTAASTSTSPSPTQTPVTIPHEFRPAGTPQ